MHEEVQYWWTRRHLETKSLATLVSTRNSGRSFKNRVELQNGCFSPGTCKHFHPVNGSCVQNGKVSEEILKKSMDLESDVCIYSHVDKCPCVETVINLYKGAFSTELQHERLAIKTFLKGKREEKELLKSEDSELYAKINSVWELRKMHMMSFLPSQYLFYLRCILLTI